MRTVFWRVAYDDNDLRIMLDQSTLIFLDFSRWPNAKNNSADKLLSTFEIGHCLLLSNLKRTTQLAFVKPFGLITGKEEYDLRLKWARPILTLTPEIPGGIQQWEKEAIFNFDVNPVRRYKLKKHANNLFKLD